MLCEVYLTARSKCIINKIIYIFVYRINGTLTFSSKRTIELHSMIFSDFLSSLWEEYDAIKNFNGQGQR